MSHTHGNAAVNKYGSELVANAAALIQNGKGVSLSSCLPISDCRLLRQHRAPEYNRREAIINILLPLCRFWLLMSQQGLLARGWALLPLPAFNSGKQYSAAAIWGHILVCCLQLASIGVVNEEPARRTLREMLFTAQGVENYISGVVRRHESWSCSFSKALGTWGVSGTLLPARQDCPACGANIWVQSALSSAVNGAKVPVNLVVAHSVAQGGQQRLCWLLLTSRQWHRGQIPMAAVPAECTSGSHCTAGCLWIPAPETQLGISRQHA